MRRIVSPLRYPGSKVRITDMVAGLLEKNLLVGCHLYEPFAGGAAVSLTMLANGFVRSATLVERDPLVYCFWKMVKEDPKALIDRMMSGQVSLSSWRRMQRLRRIDKPNKSNIAQLGYAGLFYNRTCFSGIIGAGPIGGITQSSPYKIDCRFNKKEIAASIKEASEILKNVELIFGDGVEFLRSQCLSMHPHSVVYIDPPYVTNGYKLYRYFFEESEHENLADAVSDLRVPWLLSYDNSKLIRDLYVGEQRKFVKTYQSLKSARFVKEILLLSGDFLLPSNEALEGTSKSRGRAELTDYEQ